MRNFVVETMAADGLAPRGAKPSAGTVMTEFTSAISMGPPCKELPWCWIYNLLKLP